jgi:hypothetical protein
MSAICFELTLTSLFTLSFMLQKITLLKLIEVRLRDQTNRSGFSSGHNLTITVQLPWSTHNQIGRVNTELQFNT